jgi:hypothetical protein
LDDNGEDVDGRNDKETRILTKQIALHRLVTEFLSLFEFLFCRWADQMKAVGSDGKARKFNHPFVQACAMFIGEMLCLLAFKVLYFYYWSKHVSIFHVNICIYNMVTCYMHSSLACCVSNRCLQY